MEPRITPHAHPEVVERAIRRHINPVIGKLPVEEIRPVHMADILTLQRKCAGHQIERMLCDVVPTLRPCKNSGEASPAR